MSLQSISQLVSTTIYRQPETGLTGPVSVGRLAMAGRRAALEWTQEQIAQGIPLDPLRYPLVSGLIEARGDLFGGLHGFLADSLPDAWGMRLLRRRLRREGLDLDALTPVQRLSLIGSHGRGALIFEPNEGDGDEVSSEIDALARAARAILTQEDATREEGAARILERLGSGSGGARPKAHLDLDGHACIVKFPGLSDPVDIGPIEYAYALMAGACGIEMMPSQLLPSGHGPGWFATQRFDRKSDGRRVHMVSLCGALEAPSGTTAIGYDTFMRATLAITRDAKDVEAAFARMIFNILACNRDDHSRQHAYLQDTDGAWHLSPAFDLTFSTGPGGEHELDVNGEAGRPTFDHVKALADRHGISAAKLRTMLDATRTSVAQWPSFAKNAGVSNLMRDHIATTMKRIANDFAPTLRRVR